MSIHTNTSNILLNPEPFGGASIDELFSCENLANLALNHEQLCFGVLSAIDGGAQVTDIRSLLTLLCEQSEDLSSLLNLKRSLS